MDINAASYYINPNTRTLTTNLKNTAVTDREIYAIMLDRLTPVEDMVKVLKTPINLAKSTAIDKSANSVYLAAGAAIRVGAGYVLTVKPQGVEVSGGDPYNREAWEEAQNMAGALGTLLRNAGGTMDRAAHSTAGYEKWTSDVAKVMQYLGIDTTKEFVVNGTRYGKNEHGYFESEKTTAAKEAYERQKANNQTYEFADERTKKQILHMSSYYLSTVPEAVRAAWQETLEETGINPFPNGYTSVLQQLSMEQDFLTGGNDNLFGDSIESSIDAVNRILDRIANPLAEVTEENETMVRQEKEFYQALLKRLENL